MSAADLTGWMASDIQLVAMAIALPRNKPPSRVSGLQLEVTWHTGQCVRSASWPALTTPTGARAKLREAAVIPVSTPLVRLYSEYMHAEYGGLDSDYVFVNLFGGRIGQPLCYPTVRTGSPPASPPAPGSLSRCICCGTRMPPVSATACRSRSLPGCSRAAPRPPPARPTSTYATEVREATHTDPPLPHTALGGLCAV